MNPFEPEPDEQESEPDSDGEKREDNWWLAGSIGRAIERSTGNDADTGGDASAVSASFNAEVNLGCFGTGGDGNF